MVSHLAWYPAKHGYANTARHATRDAVCVRLHRCALGVTMITQAWGLFTNAVDDSKDCGSLCDCAIGTSTYKASSGRT